jgi:hypothetical protein
MKLNSSFNNAVLSRFSGGTKFFLIVAVLFLASCKKESPIGEDIQPGSDLIDLQASDSLSLFSYTVKEDSLRSDESGIVQIGDVNDPVFGRTTAGVFTQFVIPNNLLNINFGSGAVLDSCALNLRYDYEYAGDTASTMNFNVYQVTQDMYYDSTYYSNQTKECYPTYASRISVGDTTMTGVVHVRSQTIIGNDTTVPLLRIPIHAGFAQQIFSQSGGANLASTAAFLQYMKGLYITGTTTSGTGALLRVNLKDTSTKFIFYYHNSIDTTTFSFVVNSSTAYFSHFEHDYSTATAPNNPQNQLNNPGVNTSDYVYVSGAAGLKTKITFPYLDNLKNLGYNIAINKAELVFKADPATIDGNFPINKQLYVVSIDSTGKQVLLPDMFESSSYFGGSANTTANEYRINIARYFQEVMEGTKQNTGLYLKEFDPDAQGRRVVLGSGNATAPYKMYIHLVYTRIN